MKAQLFKKGRDDGEGEDCFQAAAFGFVHDGLGEQRAYALGLERRVHTEGTNFSKLLAVEFERAASEKLSVFFRDGELPDVFVQIRQRARKQDLFGHVAA